jgi:hypothetical protein
MLPSGECPEQQELRRQYLSALSAYRKMVPARDDVSTRREFEEAYERAEEGRMALIRARFNLRHHIQQHACAAIEGTEEDESEGVF